jgi:hypothetical protein
MGGNRRLPRNQMGTERTLDALRAAGRLENVDASTVALARTLAEALDRVDPERYPSQLANLAKAQLDTLRVLRGNDDTDDRAFAQWLSSVQATMGDAPQP